MAKKPTIGTVPGYVAAVKKFKATPATKKAIAPTQAAKNILGPAFGGQGGWGNVPLPPAVSKLPGYTAPALGSVAPAPVPRTRMIYPGSYTPTLTEIETDPLYSAALGEYNVGQQTARRALGSQIGQLAIGGGYDLRAALAGSPDLLEYAGDITPEIEATMAANQLSDKAQIERAYGRQLSDIAYQQAARGTLASGATAAASSGALEQTQLAHNQRQAQLLDAIRGNIGNYLTQRSEGLLRLNDVRAQVAGLLAQRQGPVYEEEEYTPGQIEAATEEVPGAPGVPAASSGVRWGGQTFLTKAAMSKYLKGVGSSWAKWASQHPTAAQKLR